MTEKSLLSRWAPPSGAVALVVGLVAALAGAAPAAAAPGASSPEDRARFVAITRSLEAAPLAPTARDDSAWAFKWLTDAPDVSVKACLSALGDLLEPGAKNDFVGRDAVVVQYTFGLGAALISHPELAQDADAQQLAGLDSALNAYQSIQKDHPEAHSRTFDGLLKARAEGKLPAYAHKVAASCGSKR